VAAVSCSETRTAKKRPAVSLARFAGHSMRDARSPDWRPPAYTDRAELNEGRAAN
jgi:hypothetical protein